MPDHQILQCPGCGSAVTTGRDDCEYCGTKIKWPSEEVKTVQKVQIIQPAPSATYIPTRTIPSKSTSGFAIASLVMSLLGISPLGLIFGFIGLRATSDPNSNITGRGLAVAGVIISSIQILIWIIMISVTSCTAASIASSLTY